MSCTQPSPGKAAGSISMTWFPKQPLKLLKRISASSLSLLFFLAAVLAFLIHQTFHLLIFAILVVDIFRLTVVPKRLVSKDALLSSFGKIHFGNQNLKAFGHM